MERGEVKALYSFILKFWRTSFLFVGLLIPLYSGGVCPRFQSQGGFPRLHESSDSPLVRHLLMQMRIVLDLRGPDQKSSF